MAAQKHTAIPPHAQSPSRGSKLTPSPPATFRGQSLRQPSNQCPSMVVFPTIGSSRPPSFEETGQQFLTNRDATANQRTTKRTRKGPQSATHASARKGTI